MRHAHATCSRSDCAIATTSGALAAFGGRVVRMRKTEDHDHFVGSGVGDRVPRVGRDVERIAGSKLYGPVVEAELSPTADDVCHLLGLVLHGCELGPWCEDGVAERGAVAFGLLVGHEHSAPAPMWQLDRVDLLERDDGDVAHRPASGLWAGEGASGETGRFPRSFSSVCAAISAARGLRRSLKKGALRGGNMVSPTRASRRRATLTGPTRRLGGSRF